MKILLGTLVGLSTVLLWAVPLALDSTLVEMLRDRGPDTPIRIKPKSCECECTGRTQEGLAVKRDVVDTVSRLLTRAYRAVERGNYESCIATCEQILWIDPYYPVAVDLKAGAEACRTDFDRSPALRNQVREWRKSTDDGDEAVIPRSQSFRFPSVAEWSLIHPLGAKERKSALERNLDRFRIDLDCANTLFTDALFSLRERSGLRLILDAEASDTRRPERRISVSLKDRPLREVLTTVCAAEGSGYGFRVTGEGVVLIGR
jgi:hypothetical protein